MGKERYIPKFFTGVEPSIRRDNRTGKWVLRAPDGRILGSHQTPEAAQAQERAWHRGRGGTVSTHETPKTDSNSEE